MHRRALLLLALCVACRKSAPRVVSGCRVDTISAQDGAWSFNMFVDGPPNGNGKVIVTLYDLNPHQPEPNRTVVCTMEAETSWTAQRSGEIRGAPKPSCAGRPPYGNHRFMTIALLPTTTNTSMVGCSFPYLAPAGFGGEKSVDEALAEVGSPVAYVSLVPTSADAGTQRIAMFLRVPPSWSDHGGFFTEKGSREIEALFGAGSAWAKAKGTKLAGSRMLMIEELSPPMWTEQRFNGAVFYEIAADGTLEPLGPAFAPRGQAKP